MSLPFIDCQYNPKGVLCEMSGKRCDLYPLVTKAANRGIGPPVYKNIYCQHKKPWTEGQGRKSINKNEEKKQ
jgi:hypothetical protein